MSSQRDPRSEEPIQERAPEDVRIESPEDYERLLDHYSSLTSLAEGKVVRGTVLKITPEGVIVDVSYKCEGLIPLTEFLDSDGNLTVQPGDEIDVFLERGEERDGYVHCSHEKAQRMRLWDDIERAYNERTNILGRVIDRVKGGLAVNIGVRAFLPGSQVDIKPVRNLDAWKDREITCRIIKLNKRRGNIVISRKVVLEEEYAARKQQILEVLHEGAVVTGKVKNITDYGAFVDLGGLDGLLHITDMSWGRINHPSEAVAVDDEITVQVLKYDRERGRVSLGLKQLQPDPWKDILERYPMGSRVRGRVSNVTDYGAFVELEPGLEGLIHVSEMSWTRRVKHPSKVVSVDEMVEAVVLDVNANDRRIALGLKQTERDPWMELAERYPVGSVIQGRVRNLTDFGAFVEVAEGIDGLVHVSDISWTKRVNHASEVFRKGDLVEAKVLKIDVENRRLSLGVKQLEPDIWENYCTRNPVGSLVRGRVARLAPFGMFVELEQGIEGLCHISELDDHGNKEKLAVGQECEFKVIKTIPAERKIGLSLKAVATELERRSLEEYQSQRQSTTTTIEEMIVSKRSTSSGAKG